MFVAYLHISPCDLLHACPSAGIVSATPLPSINTSYCYKWGPWIYSAEASGTAIATCCSSPTFLSTANNAYGSRSLLGFLATVAFPQLVELAGMRGIGRVRAHALYEAGIWNLSDLRTVSTARLAKPLLRYDPV